VCGRFAFYSPHEAVVRLFGLPDDTPGIEPHYNIAPTTYVAAVREDVAATRRLAMLYWGLVPAWAREKAIGARMINARAETLSEKPAFRDAYRRRRALVPADGYYEWMKLGAKDKQPYFIRPASGSPFAFGALWEKWRDPVTGEPLESCAIITTQALHSIAHIHDRMPLVIRPEDHAEWLDPRNGDCERLDRLLSPGRAGEMVVRPVGRMVSNARNDGPQLIDPLPDAPSSRGLPLGAPPPPDAPFSPQLPLEVPPPDDHGDADA
jgi:putative SOS response-associated peptidase YedK